MPYVYSTASAGINYTEYRKVTKDLNQPVKKVYIAGGSNVIQKNLVTPLGVATQVSDDDLNFLMSHLSFKKHMEKGFMKVENIKKDPEKVVASGMKLADKSAQKTHETLDEGAKIQEPVKGKRGRKKKED